jgi:hypothetical protein
MRRALLLLSALLIVLAVASAASANKPTREIIPGQDDVIVTDQCDFPILIHTVGREIITTFTDSAGNPVKQIVVFPGNKTTLTNLDTGKSIRIVTTGLTLVRLQPDGSQFAKVTGHGFFAPNPVTGEPGIWYLSGRGTATFDAEGNLTSIDSAGRLVNLCPRLAP